MYTMGLRDKRLLFLAFGSRLFFQKHEPLVDDPGTHRQSSKSYYGEYVAIRNDRPTSVQAIEVPDAHDAGHPLELVSVIA